MNVARNSKCIIQIDYYSIGLQAKGLRAPKNGVFPLNLTSQPQKCGHCSIQKQ